MNEDDKKFIRDTLRILYSVESLELQNEAWLVDDRNQRSLRKLDLISRMLEKLKQ